MTEAARADARAIAPLTLDQLGRIAALVREDAGIHLPAEKLSLVSSRLGKRVRALKLKDFGAYCDFVGAAEGAEERRSMLHALTTNVTRFFREDHHFEELKRDYLPRLIETARAGGRVRIWSAGCSSGEEPYSIAMTVLGQAPDAARLNIKILATDIDPNVLAIGAAGAYSEEALAPAPKELADRHFSRGDDGLRQAGDEIRRMISFKSLNLIADWPIKGPFDAIFCRNVIIYFEQSTQDKLIARFADLTRAGSGLFLGHSERVSPALSEKFERSGFTSYRRT
ncbi:MAG: protein-glutamate O-methyltransferase [Pseudomonadota bacterium]